MDDRDDESELGIGDCLEVLGVDQLCQWDVLVFLHRHQASLAGAEQIAHLLGYPTAAVVEALTHLDRLGLARRSRASQGVRLYEFLRPEGPPRDQVADHLLALSDRREGRLELVATLRREDRRPRITIPRPAGGGGGICLRMD